VGFSPQEPVRRALEQHPVAVGRWLAGEFPAVRAQARREGGVVVWLDELGVRSDVAAGAVVGAGGPDAGRQAGREAVPGAHAQRDLECGALRFRLVTGSFTGPAFIDFLRRLVGDLAGQRVHLIVDGHPVHRAKLASAWVELAPP